MSKRIIIIAGPNGAGKTTFARIFLPDEAQLPRFINADLIAAGLHQFDTVYKAEVNDWALYDNGDIEPVLLEWSQQP